jgi:hypothetical protein
MLTQTLLFKKFWRRKPKLTDIHMVKDPSYIKMPIFLIMLGTLNIGERQNHKTLAAGIAFYKWQQFSTFSDDITSKKQTIWHLKEKLSPQEKRKRKIHSLNSSKTSGQNPQAKTCDLKEKILQS